jgi:hypothetical protein
MRDGYIFLQVNGIVSEIKANRVLFECKCKVEFSLVTGTTDG